MDVCLGDGGTCSVSWGCFRAAEGGSGPDERRDRVVPAVAKLHREQIDPPLPLRLPGNGTGGSQAPAPRLYQTLTLAAGRGVRLGNPRLIAGAGHFPRMELGGDRSRPLSVGGSGWGGTVSWREWDSLGPGIGTRCCGTESLSVVAGPCRLGWRFWRGMRELSGGPQRTAKQSLLTWRKNHRRARCSVLASFSSHWLAILEPKVVP